MHFSASDPLIKMMIDLISSANDFSIVFGVCDYLGKIGEFDFESRRVSDTFTMSRHSDGTVARGILNRKGGGSKSHMSMC